MPKPNGTCWGTPGHLGTKIASILFYIGFMVKAMRDVALEKERTHKTFDVANIYRPILTVKCCDELIPR